MLYDANVLASATNAELDGMYEFATRCIDKKCTENTVAKVVIKGIKKTKKNYQ